MRLEETLFKRVRVERVCGRVFEGDVIDFVEGSDHDRNGDCIEIETGRRSFSLYEKEIARMEVIEDDGTCERMYKISTPDKIAGGVLISFTEWPTEKNISRVAIDGKEYRVRCVDRGEALCGTKWTAIMLDTTDEIRAGALVALFED